MTSPAISGQKENGKQDSTSESSPSAEDNQPSGDQQVAGASPLMALKRLLRFANMLTSQGC